MLIGAIEGGGTKFVCGVGTSEGEIVKRISIPTTTPEETMGQVVQFFKDSGIAAMGIGMFGPIVVNESDSNYGMVTSTPKPYWSGFNVIEYMKQHYTQIPIGFDTDVNAAALGEATWGAAKGLESCLYITIGTGIGAGALVQGKLIHGLTHPEMGHIGLRRHPEDYYEGRCPYHKDCFEGLAAGPAVEERWGKKAFDLEADHFAWELESYYIAQALVNYILILSPERIILGGGVMNQSHLFPLIREHTLQLLNGYVEHTALTVHSDSYIVAPALGGNAGLCGALALAKRELQSE